MMQKIHFTKGFMGVCFVMLMILVLTACGGNAVNEGAQSENPTGIQNTGQAEPAPDDSAAEGEGSAEPTESEDAIETEEPSDSEEIVDSEEPKESEEPTHSGESVEPAPAIDPAKSEAGEDEEQHPEVTIEMNSGEKIVIELYPEIAPNTVHNFISLVEEGYYDGLIFHRVIPEFMIQGGDPTGTGRGGPGYSIKGEFSDNGVENDLILERGVISMARSQDPDSAGSQFFIVQADAPHLDGAYAAFGKVISGMEEVDRIVSVDRNRNDKPDDDQVMTKVTVDTFGVDYPEPEKIQN